ncbi:MAG: hypothetical protein ACRC62_30425 [Microcoleus sp.]
MIIDILTVVSSKLQFIRPIGPVELWDWKIGSAWNADDCLKVFEGRRTPGNNNRSRKFYLTG